MTSPLAAGFVNSATIQSVIAIERTVFHRERAAGMYAALPYALAQGEVEMPYCIIQAALYSTITYFMMGFELNAGMPRPLRMMLLSSQHRVFVHASSFSARVLR